MFCFFYAKRVFSQLCVFPEQELYLQGSRPRFSCIFCMLFSVFSRPVLELYNENIAFDMQNTALPGPHVFLVYTKKLGF